MSEGHEVRRVLVNDGFAGHTRSHGEGTVLGIRGTRVHLRAVGRMCGAERSLVIGGEFVVGCRVGNTVAGVNAGGVLVGWIDGGCEQKRPNK